MNKVRQAYGPPRKAARQHRVPSDILALILIVVGVGIATYTVTMRSRHAEPTLVAGAEAAAAAPVPTATPVTFTLTERAYTDEQKLNIKTAMGIARCPVCFGIDKPPLPELSDNDIVVFTALIGSETNYYHYDDYGQLIGSSYGCKGIAQLCFSLATEENLSSPAASLYAAAHYYRGLLLEEGGNYNRAIRRYKGIVTEDVAWMADTVLRYMRIKE